MVSSHDELQKSCGGQDVTGPITIGLVRKDRHQMRILQKNKPNEMKHRQGAWRGRRASIRATPRSQQNRRLEAEHLALTLHLRAARFVECWFRAFPLMPMGYRQSVCELWLRVDKHSKHSEGSLSEFKSTGVRTCCRERHDCRTGTSSIRSQHL